LVIILKDAGWDKALALLGKGLQEAGEGQRKKALQELNWIASQGGVLTGKQVLDLANKVQMPAEIIMAGVPKIRGEDGEIRYKFLTPLEKEVQRAEEVAKAIERTAQAHFESKLKREVTRTKAISMAEVPAKEAVIKTQAEATGEMYSNLEFIKQQNRKDLAILNQQLSELKTPEEKEELQKKIDLSEARTRYYDALADYLAQGKDTAQKKINEIWKRLEPLGLLQKSGPKGRTIKTIKPLIVGSKDYEKAKKIFEELGVEYSEIPAGKALISKQGFRKNRVLLVPKGVTSSDRSQPVLNLPAKGNFLGIEY